MAIWQIFQNPLTLDSSAAASPCTNQMWSGTASLWQWLDCFKFPYWEFFVFCCILVKVDRERVSWSWDTMAMLRTGTDEDRIASVFSAAKPWLTAARRQADAAAATGRCCSERKVRVSALPTLRGRLIVTTSQRVKVVAALLVSCGCSVINKCCCVAQSIY